jgi:hypothetical protein
MIARQNEVMRTAARVKNFTGMVFLILNNPMLIIPLSNVHNCKSIEFKLSTLMLVCTANILTKNRVTIPGCPVNFLSNPAVSLKPVAFRPCLTAGLAKNHTTPWYSYTHYTITKSTSSK